MTLTTSTMTRACADGLHDVCGQPRRCSCPHHPPIPFTYPDEPDEEYDGADWSEAEIAEAVLALLREVQRRLTVADGAS